MKYIGLGAELCYILHRKSNVFCPSVGILGIVLCPSVGILGIVLCPSVGILGIVLCPSVGIFCVGGFLRKDKARQKIPTEGQKKPNFILWVVDSVATSTTL